MTQLEDGKNAIRQKIKRVGAFFRNPDFLIIIGLIFFSVNTFFRFWKGPRVWQAAALSWVLGIVQIFFVLLGVAIMIKRGVKFEGENN